MSIAARVLACLIAATVLGGTSAAAGATAPPGRGVSADLVTAAAATAKYHSPVIAGHDGYAELRDKNGIACIADDMGGTGAMGVHFVKGSLVDGSLDIRHPEALVYAPDSGGRLHLAALEYIVPDSATGGVMPSLFGQDFMFTPDGNRFGIPAFWSLHVWVWKHNPSGTFAMFNPDVHCPS